MATPKTPLFDSLWRLVVPFGNPARTAKALVRLPAYVADALRYRQLPGAEPLRARDLYPQLFDKTSATHIDSHYYFLNAWAMRRVLAASPRIHVDVGSQVVFGSLLSASLPVVFLDYRPLRQPLSGLSSVAGDLFELPFPDASLPSLSCLHVVEHVGLGRYGDRLDPHGSEKAAAELSRVVAPGGRLLFAVPVGQPRLCFNAHRVFSPTRVLELFPGFSLESFSGVNDAGTFLEDAEPAHFENQIYACGMYSLRKGAP